MTVVKKAKARKKEPCRNAKNIPGFSTCVQKRSQIILISFFRKLKRQSCVIYKNNPSVLPCCRDTVELKVKVYGSCFRLVSSLFDVRKMNLQTFFSELEINRRFLPNLCVKSEHAGNVCVKVKIHRNKKRRRFFCSLFRHKNDAMYLAILVQKQINKLMYEIACLIFIFGSAFSTNQRHFRLFLTPNENPTFPNCI